jgi:hypothetical protein
MLLLCIFVLASLGIPVAIEVARSPSNNVLTQTKRDIVESKPVRNTISFADRQYQEIRRTVATMTVWSALWLFLQEIMKAISKLFK